MSEVLGMEEAGEDLTKQVPNRDVQDGGREDQSHVGAEDVQGANENGEGLRVGLEVVLVRDDDAPGGGGVLVRGGPSFGGNGEAGEGGCRGRR